MLLAVVSMRAVSYWLAKSQCELQHGGSFRNGSKLVVGHCGVVRM